MILYGAVTALLCFCAAVLARDHHGRRSTDDGVSTGTTAGTSTGNGTTAGEDMDEFRLPPDVRPVSYSLMVATDFGNMTFSGHVRIVVEAVSRRTCRITLNAKDLNVTGVGVTDRGSGAPLAVDRYYLVGRNEQLIVVLNDTGTNCLVPSKSYAVEIAYGAPLRTDDSGFYKSWYREDGEIKWLAVTHFQPTNARMAFPCFDEPMFKVPFNISLRRRSDQISLSNMPLILSTKVLQTNMFWDHFEITPPMSTYLVAFFIGEFYAMKTRTIGVYTHSKYINQAQYVINKSSKLIKAMENLTGIEYMLPKLDLLAIPDFTWSAMENWGLNTYREIMVLLSENDKTMIKEDAIITVQHEFAHQWFGNLVTCTWWDYIWFNEGFATYFEYFALKMVEPDWQLENVFVYEVHQTGLKYDQTPQHEISGFVSTPAEINDIFDDISYSKAGSVLRMLQYTVTERNFYMALKFYLEENAYGTVTPEDLWTAFEIILYENEFDLGDDINITQYMKSWTEQSGFPLVKIVKENNTFVITQERFLVDAIEPNTNLSTSQWIIGLTYTTESEQDFDKVLPITWLKEQKMILPNQNDSGWYIFNLQSIGFYRVDYNEDNWNALLNQLIKDCNVIHVLNRIQIIDDAFNLALANKMDYTFVLDLSEYLKREGDVGPWYPAKYEFNILLYLMRRCPDGYKHLKIYLSHLSGFMYTKVEELVVYQNNTDHSIMRSWNTFSNWACELENEDCLKSATTYFKKWQQGILIPADIKDAAFCVGVKNGNTEVWNSILEVYINSESASDRELALSALACSTDTVQLSKYLDFMFEGQNGTIHPKHFTVMYERLASKPHGIPVLIEFLSNKLDRIIKEINNGEDLAASMYLTLSLKVASDEEISKIDNLRRNQSIPLNLQTQFNNSFSNVEDNLSWFKKYHNKIGEWTKAYIREHGLDVHLITNTSTLSPETPFDEMPKSAGYLFKNNAFLFVFYVIFFRL